MNTLYRYHIIICHHYHIIYPSPSSPLPSPRPDIPLYLVNLRLFIKSENKKQKKKTFSTLVSLLSSMYLLKWFFTPFRHLYTHFRIKKKIHGRMRLLIVKLV